MMWIVNGICSLCVASVGGWVLVEWLCVGVCGEGGRCCVGVCVCVL